jgi:hypothetical protein
MRSSRLFTAYNFREYVHRRSRDAFKGSKDVTDPAEIRRLYDQGKKDLLVAQRQGALSGMFGHVDKLVIEKPRAQ